MKPSKMTLSRFAASVLIIGILTQTVFALTFGRSVSSGDFLSIDYEGSGTITHMNANMPDHFTQPPTSLLDLNVMRASDLRVEMFNAFGDLKIGLRTGSTFGVTLVSYTVQPVSPFTGVPSPFVKVGETQFGGILLGLDATGAAALQSLIDLHGANHLFLSLSIRASSSSFFGSGGVTVSSAVREIPIDVKPGNNDNSINPNSRGKIAVAVLTTATFDANTVDIDSVRFGATGSEASAEHSAFADVDGDGDLDLVLHFRVQQTNLGCGSEVALLRGTSLTGELIGHWNTISIVGCR